MDIIIRELAHIQSGPLTSKSETLFKLRKHMEDLVGHIHRGQGGTQDCSDPRFERMLHSPSLLFSLLRNCTFIFHQSVFLSFLCLLGMFFFSSLKSSPLANLHNTGCCTLSQQLFSSGTAILGLTTRKKMGGEQFPNNNC